jgi:pimeloyl-ACP methyl ester carboxylesterase
MRAVGRILLGILALLIVVALVGPFLVPVPLLEGVMPPEQLADLDSKFIELNGLNVHYQHAGTDGPLIVLLHGFASNTASWRKVLQPLSELGTVVAYDRPAFGLTERPLGKALREWSGLNPYSADAQVDQLVALIEALGFAKAILVGNSAGGTIAMHTALRHPKRVQGIVFVDPAIYTGGGMPDWLKPLLRTPGLNRLGPLLSRNIVSRGDNLIRLAWHDPDKITPEDIAIYRRPMQVEGWDRALWEFTLASRNLQLGERVKDLRVPALVITGDDDRIVPTQQSIRFAEELPNAGLVVIPKCGHVPQEECPEPFLQAATDFIERFC